jgi:nucleoside-diphosphate-sugar epimerase
MAVARITAGLQDRLYLGNLDAVRDWGHAKEYVRAMYLMLQQEEPDDYVIGTGEGHTVREFCKLVKAGRGRDRALEYAGLIWVLGPHPRGSRIRSIRASSTPAVIIASGPLAIQSARTSLRRGA